MSSAPPVEAQESSSSFPWTRSLLTGVLVGTLFGLIFRVGFSGLARTHLSLNGFANLLSICFLALGPMYIGFVTIQIAERSAPRTVATCIFAPWLPVLLATLASFLFLLEGFLCIIFALPITLLFGSIGGMLAGGISRRRHRLSNSALSSLALLPFLLSPAESLLPVPVQTRTVRSEIRIHAPASVVWQNIARVRAIAPAELCPSWTHLIGFPRPVEATLSHEGLGGVRHASFERGLLFIETVTAWEPEQRLAFSIRADTEHIPPTTLDEHVTIGGRYFDILDGEYRLEPLGNGDILLHLTSRQRLSTDLNGYAGLWTDAVMQNLQTSILQVIQHRCQSTTDVGILPAPER